jgi:DNA primase
MQCPFRDKHTDGSGQVSMFLTPDINAYHCFSCKSKGKLTQLLVREFDISLTDAYDYINMDAYLTGSRTTIKEAIREDPYYKLATPKMYSKRKISESVLRNFKLGYNSEDVVIPYIENNKIVGYIKRNIENPTRYNLDFKRGKYVYNYKPKNSSAIIVEGAADVWRLVSWGLHAEGLGGTEFSLEIVEKLKAHKELYFALDNDIAGIRCADKLYQALYRDVEIHFIEYDGEDPEKSTRSSFFEGYKDPKDYYEFKSTFIDILEY